MAFCSKCGTEVAAGVRFCPSCGAEMPASAPQPPQGQWNQPQQSLNRQQNYAGASDANDVQSNKIFAILAYFGILVLVPWFAAPNSRFAKFHAKEGIKLCFFYIATIIVTSLLGLIRHRVDFGWGIYYYETFAIVTIIRGLLYIPVAILAILGIINAAQGQEKKLPFLDKVPFESFLPFLR